MFESGSHGELPPPPKAYIGRDELIRGIVGFVGDPNPIVFIGAGGVGQTLII